MQDAAWSAVATFGLWFGLVLAGFLLVGIAFNWATLQLLPRRQEYLPRQLWTLAVIVATLFVGGASATNVGVMHGLIAFGDALADRDGVVVLGPTSDEWGSDPTEAAARMWQQMEEAIATEGDDLASSGIVTYTAGHLLLGSLYEPGVITWEIGKEYRAILRAGTPGDARTHIRQAWEQARPNLARLSIRKLGASVLFGALYLAALFVLGLLLIAVSWRGIRDQARVRAAEERYRKARDEA